MSFYKGSLGFPGADNSMPVLHAFQCLVLFTLIPRDETVDPGAANPLDVSVLSLI